MVHAVEDYLTRSSHSTHRAFVLVDGEIAATLKPSDGYIRIDMDASFRRNARISVSAEDSEIPTGFNDLLAPGVNDLLLQRGILFDDGTEELIDLGVFRISRVEIEDSKETFGIGITGYDRSRAIARNRLEQNYVVDIGERYEEEIKRLIDTFSPFPVQYNFPLTDFLTPRIVLGGSGDTPGGNPWQYATEMAESIGMDLFFDRSGICTMRRFRDVESFAPVWNFREGSHGTLLYLTRIIDDEELRNVIVVTGENSENDDPVRAVARDDNPASPTYYDGPFGQVTGFLHSRYVRTEAQAQELAEARLRQRLSLIERARITGIVHPALEAGDVVHVHRLRSNIHEDYVVNSATIPLSAQDPMQVSLTERRIWNPT